MERSCKICVVGASGFIGSGLVKKLLEKGCTVHAILTDLKNESNEGLLKSFPHAEARLLIFEEDIHNPNEFEAAIQGCECVFYVDPPKDQTGSQHKKAIEAAIAGAKSIVMSCKRAGTVRRLVFTSSVVSASPLKDDGSGFKDSMDENCWTPLIDSFSYLYHDDFHRCICFIDGERYPLLWDKIIDVRLLLKDYTYSKTLTEKELLSYGSNGKEGGLEVVTVSCGLVGGDTLQSSTPVSVLACISQVVENARGYQLVLKFLEELLGKIPLVHIDDLCEAHIFCMENPSINGRFLCASSYVSSHEIANYYVLHYPEFHMKQENTEGPIREIKWGSTKLNDKGFVYKYDTKMILDDCIKCARRMGHL